MKIRTLPVYSPLADLEDIPAVLRTTLPDGLRLYQHQLATYRELMEGDADVVVNTAMTGDGKSLAGELPALVDNRPLLAMYPTNELIRDQLRQVELLQQRWRSKLGVRRLDATELDRLVDETGLLRRDELVTVLRNHEIVLTNPDIFHYIMQMYYTRTGDPPDRIIDPLLMNFEQFTFDEFHLFQTPEAVAIINALIFIHEFVGPQRRKKFLFLSATPDDRLVQALDRAELRAVQVRGTYIHSWDPPDLTSWQRILHGATLTFSPQRAEEWVEAHLEDTLLRFFREYRPAAKGAIIVDSVAAAQRLVARMRGPFAEHGLSVASNTGFDAAERRRTSYDADLLIGTSTIDVGVDFQINFLVFESHDAGSFLQRLGRLGRHDGFTREGDRQTFAAFEAHALVPPWIQERLFLTEGDAPPPLAEGDEIDRERLAQAIRAAFPQPTTFARYRRIWGGLQAASVLRRLYHPTIKDQYADMRTQLGRRYSKSLGIRMSEQLNRLRERQKTERAILDEVRSFRGGGDLPCGVIDEQETGAARVKQYDLIGLLRNFNLVPLTREEFMREVEHWGLPANAFRNDRLVAYFRTQGVCQERNDLRFVYNQDIASWGIERFGAARVVRHLEIDAAGVSELNALNRGLRQRHFVALFCLQPPAELMRRLRLPWRFPVHPFVSRDGCEGSVGFGRQALLLEVALRDHPGILSGGENQAIIL